MRYATDNQNKILKIIFVLIFILISIGIFISNKGDRVRSVNGSLDLKGWNFKKDGIVPLNGEWNFNWEDDKKNYNIKVPSPWNMQKRHYLFNSYD